MAKAIVVYDSKYGNTRLVAETIADGMKQVPGTEIVLTAIDKADLNQIDTFDVILVGSPNHMGRPTRSVTNFIDKLGKLKLEGKQGAVFDTYMAADFEKAVKKMERQISEKVRGLTLLAPGLSIKVDRMKGPLTGGELPRCQEFGTRIATLVRK